MAIEIVPDVGLTKGTALRMILEHVGGVAVMPRTRVNDETMLKHSSQRPILEGSRLALDLARRRPLNII